MVPLIGKPFLYLLAIAVGTAVTAGLVIVLKGMRKAPAGATPESTPAAAEARTTEPVAA